MTLLEQSRLDALEFVKLPAAYTDLGNAYLVRASRATDDVLQNNYAQIAIAASRKSLKLAPLNGFAWILIASANIMLGSEKYPDALEAWRTSIAVARFDSFLLPQRIHLGIILYANMTEEVVSALRDQLRMAYHWHRRRLRSYLWRNKLQECGFPGEPESEAAKHLATQP